MKTIPRVYVASLSDYNAARLHGAWIDADQPAEDILAEVKEMLAASPEPGAEEWAIHDHEGFCGIRIHEYESFETVARVAALLKEHGDAFIACYTYECDLVRAEQVLRNGYLGCFDSLADYGEEYWRNAGWLEGIPEDRQGYIDFEDWADDERLSGEIYVREVNGKLYIFDGRV